MVMRKKGGEKRKMSEYIYISYKEACQSAKS